MGLTLDPIYEPLIPNPVHSPSSHPSLQIPSCKPSKGQEFRMGRIHITIGHSHPEPLSYAISCSLEYQVAQALVQAGWPLGDLRKILHNWWPLHLVTTAIDPLSQGEGLAPGEQGPWIPKISEPGSMTEVSGPCPVLSLLVPTAEKIGTYFYIILHK